MVLDACRLEYRAPSVKGCQVCRYRPRRHRTGRGGLIYFNVQAEATDAAARSSAAAASSSAAAASSAVAAAALRDRARAAAPAEIAEAARERAKCGPDPAEGNYHFDALETRLCKLSVFEKYGTCDQSESKNLTLDNCVDWLIGKGKVK
ncbi:hypothetical protein FK529_09205 [Tsukamurella asaccharolytica]|uniref:Uncharacterized protein n=1 Tax=Tsukamurella asaccharolytica TaxID=2592067 RepID=A0A5C5R9N1_9ACTN|nr:hypothetical protein [Tsukamurella asaccharolytica]TWS19372.1 hypothetical protein FK529_09205 [Tsukamurella asaccharolytica]